MVTWVVECIAEMYCVSVHLYADDTQLCVLFDMNDADDLAAAKSQHGKCISKAHSAAWVTENKFSPTRTRQK